MKRKARLLPFCCAAIFCVAGASANAQSPSSEASSEAALIAQYEADLAAANPDGTIPNQYIVTLSDAIPHLDKLGLEQQVQRLLASVGGGEILRLYSTLFYGFAVRLPAEKAALLKALPVVAEVEPARLVALNGTAVQQNPPNWGLDRIDQPDKVLDKKFFYPSTGAGAHVFIVDSGIRSTHQEFTGRLKPGISYVPGESTTEDCDGHGTHVAGIAVGTTYGVAKGASVYPVRVTSCAGHPATGTLDVFDGLEWVTEQVYYYGKKPAVVNLSIGVVDKNNVPIKDSGFDSRVKTMVQKYDISVVVAAGNSNVDACGGSPAREPTALTVASSTQSDARAPTSSYGKCVDLFAPGDNITSASYQSDTGSAVMGGTSMAAPHVTGFLAIKRAADPKISADTLQKNVATDDTTPDKITDVGTGSPNKLLLVRSDRPPVAAANAADCSILFLSKTCKFDASPSTDDQKISKYEWDFGDGTKGTGVTATHTYTGLGRYMVSLTVTDSAGQQNTLLMSIVTLGVLQ